MSLIATTPTQSAQGAQGLVSVRVGKQAFGVPVLRVQDVIAQTAINRVPLGPPEVAGSLNLRGRIVTAIDMRRRLNMEPRRPEDGFMSVIVERNGELYALLVDDVGDVLWLPSSQHEAAPVTLSSHWRSLCDGLYRLEGELLLVFNIEEVLALSRHASAPTPAPAQPVKSAGGLAERLGAPLFDAASELLSKRIKADPTLSRVLGEVGLAQASLQQRPFLCVLTAPAGDPAGELRAVHRPLVVQGLDEAAYDAVAEHLASALKDLGASDADVAEAGALMKAGKSHALAQG